MQKLHLGIMTYEELIAWHGKAKSIDSFKSNFTIKYGPELEQYCLFERYKKGRRFIGIDVKEIYIDEYINKESKDYKRLQEFIPKHIKENPQGTTGVWMRMDYFKTYPDCTLAKGTIENYIREICTSEDWYGKFQKNNPISIGRKGICIKVPGYSIEGKPYPMTDEDIKLRDELLIKYVVDPQKDFNNLNKIYFIAENQIEGDKEIDFVNCFNFKEAYKNFRSAFKNQIGGWPILIRIYEDGVYWNENGVEKTLSLEEYLKIQNEG